MKHCVQFKESTVRISIGSFMGPPQESIIEAPVELVDCQHPRLYNPSTYDEYKQIRGSKKIPTDEALSFLQVQT